MLLFRCYWANNSCCITQWITYDEMLCLLSTGVIKDVFPNFTRFAGATWEARSECGTRTTNGYQGASFHGIPVALVLLLIRALESNGEPRGSVFVVCGWPCVFIVSFHVGVSSCPSHEFMETCHFVTILFHEKRLHERCYDTTTPESIHTKDESKHGSGFAFIFGVNWPVQLM